MKNSKKDAAPAAPSNVQEAEPVAETALATRPANNALAAAEELGFDVNDQSGKEGITSEDMRIPYLSIAQKTSKALERGEAAFIEDLEFLEMYNSETKEIYGQGPVLIIPMFLRKRAHLIDENKKMGEQVDWNDPRVIPPWKPGSKVKSHEDLEGVRIIDWIAMLQTPNGVNPYEPVVISFKSKSYKAGEALCTFVNGLSGPAYSGQYELTSVLEKNDSGSFGKFTVAPKGRPSREVFQLVQAYYQQIKDRNIAIDAEVVEVEATASEVESQTKRDDKVPF